MRDVMMGASAITAHQFTITHPLRFVYVHKTCSTATRIDRLTAERLRVTTFVTGWAYCKHCHQHFFKDQFVWQGSNEKVGL